MRRALTVAAVAACGWLLAWILACGGPAPRGSALPASEPEPRAVVWGRCVGPIRDARCGGDVLFGLGCTNTIRHEYFGQATEADARIVILRNGCPEAVAGPVTCVSDAEHHCRRAEARPSPSPSNS